MNIRLRHTRAVNRLDLQPYLPPPPIDLDPATAPVPAPAPVAPPAPPPPRPKPRPKPPTPPPADRGYLVLPVPVRGLRLSTPISPTALDPSLLRPDGQPQPDVELQLCFESAPQETIATARINGKSYRRCVKAVQQAGEAGGFMVLQGTLKPSAGGTLTIEAAGLSFQPKLPAAGVEP